MTTFTGFSEEDLVRIKSGDNSKNNVLNLDNTFKKVSLPSILKNKQTLGIRKQNSDEAIDNLDFDKCRLSIKTPTSPTNNMFNEIKRDAPTDNEVPLQNHTNGNYTTLNDTSELSKDLSIDEPAEFNNNLNQSRKESIDLLTIVDSSRKESIDVVRGVDLTEDELSVHRAKLEELQLKQKLMEEQNKKRKEMLAKALADRTRQTEEEVLKLEKIKKELQILDGQFTQDVAVLRKKIDQACLTYAEAEKHYLKVEKEFLQAKIQLQKEKEKKELLTEHLCALITHNETRKAQKLETLMLELATNKKANEVKVSEAKIDDNLDVDEEPIIVDGVDQRTGKIVEFPSG